MTRPEGQTQVIARAQSISLIHCLFRLVKCKFTEPHYKSAWYTLLSLLIFSTYALSIKREGRNLTKKKKKEEISRLLRLLHSSAVMLSKARYCDIAVTATALVWGYSTCWESLENGAATSPPHAPPDRPCVEIDFCFSLAPPSNW